MRAPTQPTRFVEAVEEFASYLRTEKGTGLRLSELLRLKLSDIDLNTAEIRVMGKGSKERVIPLNDGTVEVINAYLAVATDGG